MVLFTSTGEVIMWARIENGVVMEITDIDPDGRFHPSLIWVPCGKDTSIGYVFTDGAFTPDESI